ncbi:MAG: hypothetical protein AABX71_02280 [Nanoarchaeota archaeon]
MKKRLLLAPLLLILTLTLVSAAYTCSDGSELSTASKEISENNRASVNGLGIAVIKAEESAVLNKIEADLLIGAEKVMLTNETRSEIVDIAGTEYNISLVNVTDTTAKIKIDGSTDEIVIGELDVLKGLEVLVVEAEKGSLGEISAEIIVGTDEVSLSNTEKPAEIITFDEKQYLLEISSASDIKAIIAVSKCKTGNITLISEEVEEKEENATEEENLTETNITEEPETAGEEETEKPFYKETWFLIPAVIIIIIFLFAVYIKIKHSYTAE